MPHTFDHEYLEALEPLLPVLAQRPKPALHDIAGRRTNMDLLFNPALQRLTKAEDVNIKVHTVKTADGYDMAVSQITKIGSPTPGPAIVYAHGGGFIGGSAMIYNHKLSHRVSDTGVSIFNVEYRLAPEFPAPTAVEDGYAALQFVSANAASLGVDPTRIALYGESAGAGLCAGLAIMARDRGLDPPLKKQLLIYPMLDDTSLQVDEKLEPFLVWKTADNITAWTAYVGQQAGDPNAPISPYAAPARVKSVEGLPPTYMDMGSLDLFRDEDIRYALRLYAAHIECELHVYPGVPHAFDAIAPQISITQTAVANRRKAIMAI